MRRFAKLLITNVQRGKVYNNVNHGTSKTNQKKRNPKLRSKFIILINTTNQMTQKQIKIYTPMFRFNSEAKGLGDRANNFLCTPKEKIKG